MYAVYMLNIVGGRTPVDRGERRHRSSSTPEFSRANASPHQRGNTHTFELTL